MSESTEKAKAKPKVTAFELNPDVVGDNDSHAFTFGGFPGRWQVGRPILPAALGLTVTGMRDLVDRFNLPLVEVQVKEGDAFDTFEEDPQRMPSGPQYQEPPQAQPELIEVNGQLIPGPGTPPPAAPMNEVTAAQVAAATKALYPGDTADEIVADIPVDEDSPEADAAREAAGGEV